VYKLVELRSDNAQPRAVAKLSEGKETYPCAKQIWRQSDDTGTYAGDIIGAANEKDDGKPLLQCVMREGRRVAPPARPEEMQRYAAECLSRIPAGVSDLTQPSTYPVRISHGLKAQLERVRVDYRGRDAA
jgi:nicotinate phosphoribosyltransferase